MPTKPGLVPRATITPVKLPPVLKERIEVLARKTERSLHSLIVEAVARHVACEEKMQAFVAEALAADADMGDTGKMYRAEDVHAWAERLTRDYKTRRPTPWRR